VFGCFGVVLALVGTYSERTYMYKCINVNCKVLVPGKEEYCIICSEQYKKKMIEIVICSKCKRSFQVKNLDQDMYCIKCNNKIYEKKGQ